METYYKLGDCEGFRLNPCVCGCERVAFFRKNETTYIKCVMCLMTASGAGEDEARRQWNTITKGVEVRYAKIGETKASGEAKASRRRAKKGVSGESLS